MDPRKQIEPDFFFGLLKQNHFYEILFDVDKKDSKTRSMLLYGMLAAVQDQINIPDFILTINKNGQINLIGQKHNDPKDFALAEKYLIQAVQNNNIILLESNGEVHPNRPADLFKIINTNAVEKILPVTENELYTHSSIRRFDSMKEISTVQIPPISGYERSLIVGMYLANLIAFDPNKSLTVIFGDNHIEDIKKTIQVFHEYMKFGSVKINDVLSTSGRDVKNAREFNLEILNQAKEKFIKDFKIFKIELEEERQKEELLRQKEKLVREELPKPETSANIFQALKISTDAIEDNIGPPVTEEEDANIAALLADFEFEESQPKITPKVTPNNNGWDTFMRSFDKKYSYNINAVDQEIAAFAEGNGEIKSYIQQKLLEKGNIKQLIEQNFEKVLSDVYDIGETYRPNNTNFKP